MIAVMAFLTAAVVALLAATPAAAAAQPASAPATQTHPRAPEPVGANLDLTIPFEVGQPMRFELRSRVIMQDGTYQGSEPLQVEVRRYLIRLEGLLIPEELDDLGRPIRGKVAVTSWDRESNGVDDAISTPTTLDFRVQPVNGDTTYFFESGTPLFGTDIRDLDRVLASAPEAAPDLNEIMLLQGEDVAKMAPGITWGINRLAWQRALRLEGVEVGPADYGGEVRWLTDAEAEADARSFERRRFEYGPNDAVLRVVRWADQTSRPSGGRFREGDFQEQIWFVLPLDPTRPHAQWTERTQQEAHFSRSDNAFGLGNERSYHFNVRRSQTVTWRREQ